MENEIGHTSNNRGEFVSKKIDAFLTKCGIQWQTSAPYSTQQNGVTKCANRIIMECVRSMIFAQRLEFEFWGEVMNMALYIKNRCPTKAFDSKTPQEAWSGKKPDVFHLKIFGYKAFAHVHDEKRIKLKSKSMLCVFLRYYEGAKAYHLMCVKTKRIIKSRDVMFIEGSKEIGGVLHPKKIENVVMHEIMNKEVEGEEPLTLSWDTPLNETTMEGVQNESALNSSLEEEFVVLNDNPSSHVPKERPQRQRKEWLWDWWIATKDVECAIVVFLEEPQYWRSIHMWKFQGMRVRIARRI